MRACLAVLVVLVASPAAAQEPGDSVRVEVDPLFGEGTLLHDAYVPIVVELENRTEGDLHGVIELHVRGYAGELETHEAQLDLPARATRQAMLTPFVDGEATDIEVRFVVNARVVGRASASPSYTGGVRSIVVLGDPPRLHGALIDVELEAPTPTGPRHVRPPAGVVRMDPASGDPMLPSQAAGWAPVKLLVASAPVLARASESERAAIADWVRAGGSMIVFPRSESDLRERWLTRLAGPVAIEPSSAVHALVPPTGEHFELSCSEGQRTESFGCSAGVGLGRIYLASYDGTTPSAIESGAPRALVTAVYGAPSPYASLQLGGGHDALRETYGPEGSFGALRAALDPNEGFRPALIFVALVLLLYVVVVGPLNFRWVQKKNRPALALITTPVIALACMLALLVVGYLGKGVSMRYRRVELVELVEGQRRAPARRYTGLFSTRPGSFDLPGLRQGELAHRIGHGGRGPVHRHEGGRVRLADFHAGLWETVFLREDRVVDLGGEIRFEREEGRVSAVVNDTPVALTNAFIVDDGAVYAVGDVPAHGRAPIARSAAWTATGGYYDVDTALRSIARAVHIARDEEPYLRGLLHVVPHALANPAIPGSTIPSDAPGALYARVPAEPSPVRGFAREADHRWIRVFARMRGAPVTEAPPPTEEPLRIEDAMPTDVDVLDAPDAGVAP